MLYVAQQISICPHSICVAADGSTGDISKIKLVEKKLNQTFCLAQYRKEKQVNICEMAEVIL